MSATVKSVHEHMWKHTIQCFRGVTYHACVFNMACAGVCK